MSLKVSFVVAPLAYAIFLLFVTGNIAVLEGAIGLSFLIGGIATAALAGLNIFGLGENAGGTIILFILITGAGFYGFATAGGGVIDEISSALVDAWTALNNFWNWLTQVPPPPTTATTEPPKWVVAAEKTTHFPYDWLVTLLLGIMYAVGLFLLVADRGGD